MLIQESGKGSAKAYRPAEGEGTAEGQALLLDSTVERSDVSRSDQLMASPEAQSQRQERSAPRDR